MEKFSFLFEMIDNFELISLAEKVYGPYLNKKTDRSIVIIKDDNGKCSTVSYPKHLVEKFLGKKLDKDTTIDHWDSNKSNNDLSNLRIVPRDQHSADDTRRVKMIELTCEICGRKFERSPRLIRDKSKKGKVSAFCSRECAGKYSREVQLGLREKLPVQEAPESEYYKRKYVEAYLDFVLSKYDI